MKLRSHLVAGDAQAWRRLERRSEQQTASGASGVDSETLRGWVKLKEIFSQLNLVTESADTTSDRDGGAQQPVFEGEVEAIPAEEEVTPGGFMEPEPESRWQRLRAMVTDMGAALDE